MREISLSLANDLRVERGQCNCKSLHWTQRISEIQIEYLFT